MRPLPPSTVAGIEGAAAALCPFEAMIPIAGPFIAAACPGEETALAVALGMAEQKDAGPAEAPINSERTGPARSGLVGTRPGPSSLPAGCMTAGQDCEATRPKIDAGLPTQLGRRSPAVVAQPTAAPASTQGAVHLFRTDAAGALVHMGCVWPKPLPLAPVVLPLVDAGKDGAP